MPFFTRPASLLLLAVAVLAASPALQGGPRYPRLIGWVEGSASAVYSLDAPGAPPPPSFKCNGFVQEVEGARGHWRIKVQVSLRPLRVRTPFRPGRLPASLDLPTSAARSLEARLSNCAREDQAVDAVLTFLRERLHYKQKPDFDETFRSVMARGESSCVGMTHAAVTILKALGVKCREIVGLKVPASKVPVSLQGGRLHAWIEIDFPEVGPVFCDPFRSTNWVPQNYVVLRDGGGLDVGGLKAYTGGRISLLDQKDRTFYEPPAGADCLLWARPSADYRTGSIITGKLLGGMDIPLHGTATLAGNGGIVSMKLWEGNFFFNGLEPGVYELTVVSAGGSRQRENIRLTGMDKRRLIFYSRTEGE